MPTDQISPNPPASAATEIQAAEKRPLTPAAERALAEASARHADHRGKATEQAKEINGRGGLDPIRYGDWEVGGLASDF